MMGGPNCETGLKQGKYVTSCMLSRGIVLSEKLEAAK